MLWMLFEYVVYEKSRQNKIVLRRRWWILEILALAWKAIALYKYIFNFSNNGGGSLGDVNISALLTSFQTGYDKRVRPNYGGKRYYKSRCFLIIIMDIPVTKKRRKAQLIYVSLFHQEKIREQNSMMEYILFRSILWLYHIKAKNFTW